MCLVGCLVWVCLDAILRVIKLVSFLLCGSPLCNPEEYKDINYFLSHASRSCCSIECVTFNTFLQSLRSKTNLWKWEYSTKLYNEYKRLSIFFQWLLFFTVHTEIIYLLLLCLKVSHKGFLVCNINSRICASVSFSGLMEIVPQIFKVLFLLNLHDV